MRKKVYTVLSRIAAKKKRKIPKKIPRGFFLALICEFRVESTWRTPLSPLDLLKSDRVGEIWHRIIFPHYADEGNPMFSFRGLSASFSRFFRGWDRFVGAIFRPIKRFFVFAFFSLWNWGRTRNWLYFLQGLPALVTGIAILAIVGLWFSISSETLQAKYLDKAQSAFGANDFPSSMVAYERLASMGQDRPENLYKMALALEKMNQFPKALKIMTQLAPPDQKGYAKAQKWMALYNSKLFDESKFQDLRKKRLVEAHLKLALEGGLTDADDIHAVLGWWYARTGKFEEASTHLGRAVKARPDLRIVYAKVLAQQKKTSAAIDQTKLAVKYYRDIVESNPTDKTARINWAGSLVFLEKFDQGIDVLKDGFILSNGDIDYQREMANVCYIWQGVVAQKDPTNTAKQLEILQAGLRFDGANKGLLMQLLGFVAQNSKDEGKARALLNKVIAEPGQHTTISHFIIGTDAWQLDDKKTAVLHLEMAYKLDPTLPAVANNLAYFLAHIDKPELPKALKIIDGLLKSRPQEPTFRDTRGRIYMKMGYWKDAALDFEFVMGVQPDFPMVHQCLAEVYDELGQPEIAREHRLKHEESERARAKTKAK